MDTIKALVAVLVLLGCLGFLGYEVYQAGYASALYYDRQMQHYKQ